MARRIVVTSGKGGVGKTTVCANLGAKLASFGFNVLLVDADMGLNNLDVVMGIENKIVFDVTDVIEARCRPEQALIEDKRYPSLKILPSAQSYSQAKATGEHLKYVLDMLESKYDYILIDCPAGVEAGFHRAVFPATEAIVVVTPHISSIRDADKIISILSAYNLQTKQLVINRVRGDLLLSGEMISNEEIVKFLKIQLLGVVPDDDDISTLATLGIISTQSKASRAFYLLAENLHNGTKKIYDCTKKYKGIIGNLRRSLKRKT
ncbi:MAG: septum site-determining protein MinD [Clostridia bacterium]